MYVKGCTTPTWLAYFRCKCLSFWMPTWVNSCSTWIKLSSESSNIKSNEPHPLVVDWWFRFGIASYPGLHSNSQSSPIVLSMNSSTFFTMAKPRDACAIGKVEKILKGSLDLIPSPSVKIQILGRKVCLRCKGKPLLVVVNKCLKTKI